MFASAIRFELNLLMIRAFALNCSPSLRHFDGGTGKLNVRMKTEKTSLLSNALLFGNLPAIRVLIST
jgi:hypothetical protein